MLHLTVEGSHDEDGDVGWGVIFSPAFEAEPLHFEDCWMGWVGEVTDCPDEGDVGVFERFVEVNSGLVVLFYPIIEGPMIRCSKV